MFDASYASSFIPLAGEIVKNQRERTERTQSLINSRAAQSVKCSRALKGKHCKVDLCWSQCCKSIDAPWFFSGCFVVVRLAGIYIDFSLANISPGLFVSKCEQTWCKTKHIAYQNHPSLIPWFNSWRNPREGREEWDDPEVYPFKSWTRGPSDFLLSGLGRRPQRELYFDQPEFGAEQNRPWSGKGLVFGVDGVKEGKRAAGFHRKEQDTATWKWSQWNAQRTWKQCTVFDFKWEAREYIVLHVFQVGGLQKGDI